MIKEMVHPELSHCTAVVPRPVNYPIREGWFLVLEDCVHLHLVFERQPWLSTIASRLRLAGSRFKIHLDQRVASSWTSLVSMERRMVGNTSLQPLSTSEMPLKRHQTPNLLHWGLYWATLVSVISSLTVYVGSVCASLYHKAENQIYLKRPQ